MRKNFCEHSNRVSKFICIHPRCHSTPIICEICRSGQGCQKQHTHSVKQMIYLFAKQLHFLAGNFIEFTKISYYMTNPFDIEMNLLEIDKQSNILRIPIQKKHLKVIKNIHQERYQLLTGNLISKVYYWFLQLKALKEFKRFIDQKYYKIICMDQQEKSIKRKSETCIQYLENQVQCFKEKKRRIQTFQRLNDFCCLPIAPPTFEEQKQVVLVLSQKGTKKLTVQQAQMIYKEGVKLMNQSKYKPAQKLFKKCLSSTLQLQHKFYEPYYGLGKLYFYKEDYKLSEKMYKKALNINPQKLEIYLAFVQLYTKTNNTIKLKNIYHEAIKKLTKKLDLKLIIKDCVCFHISNYQNQNFDEVFEILQNAHQKKIFNQKQFLNLIAEVSYHKGQLKYSQEFYQQFLSKETSKQNRQQTLVVLADIYIRQKQYKTALQHLKKIEQTSTEVIQVWYFKCIIYKSLGEYDKALQFIQKALSQKPEKQQYIYEKACLLFDLKQYSQSHRLLLQLYEDQQIKQHQLIKVYYKMGMYDQVSRTISQHLQLDDKTNSQISSIFNMVANINYQTKNISTAILSYTQALSYNEDSQYYINRAKCFLDLQRISDAIEDYLIANEIKNSNEFGLQICQLYLMKYRKNNLEVESLKYSLKHIEKVISQSKYICSETKQKYLIKKGDILFEMAIAQNNNTLLITQALECFINAVDMNPENKSLLQRILHIKQQLQALQKHGDCKLVQILLTHIRS